MNRYSLSPETLRCRTHRKASWQRSIRRVSIASATQINLILCQQLISSKLNQHHDSEDAAKGRYEVNEDPHVDQSST